MKSYSIKLDPLIEKKSELYFQKIKISSDKGLFLSENWEVKEEIAYDFVKNDIQLQSKTDNSLMTLSVNSSNKRTKITRRYFNLLNFAGDMSGILNLLIFLFGNFNSYISKFKMLEDI